MGSRAHYVVKADGSWKRRYTHWGAHSMELDLLAGPNAATRFAQGQQSCDRWLDELECEAAALIDHDERRLLWHSHCYEDVAYRAAVLAVMAPTWPGWRIEWAYGGLYDILDALGEPLHGRFRDRSSFQDDLRAPVRRTAGPSERDDELRGLRRLVEKFDAHQEVDEATQSISLLLHVVGALTSTAHQAGLETQVASDNAFAHRPMDLTDEEKVAVHAAFEAVRNKHSGS
ncbi:hypothetical protein [Actinoallomurus iriomotensis]|uniref:Uncharacterized protein n=1 Tax=Actinoallomurus iriomotensis TaxID=478107 RepID=A0A9W6RT71_9ACTN|nr:hypothetical protein [Actinoallomurus iriomotensis]GLY81119.1 hypothetical protein Airi01_093860 [Actinoallomurus iriomotensis]